MKFLGSFRKALKPAQSLTTDTLASLKVPNSGLKTFDDTFGSLNFSLKNSTVLANDVPLHAVERLFRRGDLLDMFSALKKTNTLTVADEIKFRQLLDTPELKLREMESNIKQSKILHPELDIKISSVADIENLPATTKTKLSRIIDNLKKVGTTGGAVAGLLAAIVIGSDMYSNLVAATKARNGLYVLVRSNGETVSYKLTSKSCVNQEVPSGSSPYSGQIELDNVALFVLYAINIDATSKNNIETILGESISNENFKSILSNETNLTKLTDYYYSSDYKGPLNIPSPCDVASSGGGTVPACIAWNPSATPEDLQYFNTYNLPDNMTLECVTNSSLLETIVDAAGDKLSSVLGSGSTLLQPILKYLAYIIGVVFVIALSLGIYQKLKTPKPRSGYLPLIDT